MRGGTYFVLMLAACITFLGTALMVARLDSPLFIREFYLALFLLVLSGVGLFGVANRLAAGGVVLLLYFALAVLNTLYLHFAVYVGRSLLFVMLAAGLAGLFVSCAHTKRKKRRAVPKVIIEDLPELPGKARVVKSAQRKKPGPKPGPKPGRRKTAAKKQGPARGKTGKKKEAKSSRAKKATSRGTGRTKAA